MALSINMLPLEPSDFCSTL